MLLVKLNKLQEIEDYRKVINDTPLEDIVWLRDGERIRPSDKDIEEFKFAGLSNIWFAKDMGWLK